jgi:lipoprotein-anchoring transpeptidase ErfK/SrfK
MRQSQRRRAVLCLVPAKCCAQNGPRFWGRRGFVLRVSISAVVIAFAFAGSLGAASAQYYPPQPAPPYAGGPTVYRDANGVAYDPRYVQPAPDDAPAYFAPQPLPAVDGAAVVRPPADVAGASNPDVTGSIRSPIPPAASAGPQPASPTVVAALPPEDQPEQGPPAQLPPQFRRQVVSFATPEPAGTIIIDTPNTYLYLILGNGQALRYGIGVGREGFTWSGTERISRMKEWPDWFPPPEMIVRQPYLPRFMAGGESNPLGARAMYLGNTLYRIHGTNQPSTIGTFVSSGCIRLANDDVADLYSRVGVGTRVVVLPGALPNTASGQTSQAPQAAQPQQISEGPPVPPAPLTR